MKVPAFLLRRLYVKGSLARTADGFRFQIRNQLGSGYARRLFPLRLDGVDIPLEETTFEIDGKAAAFAAVSQSAPFTLAMNKTTTIEAKCPPPTEGPHRVEMRFEVAGLGEMGFDFTDLMANPPSQTAG
ncbi:MAG: hypothetical protein FJ318_00375 [SAR202 cluster bacterium]|nr:hypothetical protein [SAR202 cluster bacterium]